MTRLPRVALEDAFAGQPDLSSLATRGKTPGLDTSAVIEALTRNLYGPIPEPPTETHFRRSQLQSSGGERIVLTLALPKGSLTVDAALWCPDGDGPWPLICGLDFVGPAGLLFDREFPLDRSSIIVDRPEFGVHDGRLRDVLRGTSAMNWPVSLLNSSGYAVLVSCYGSWVPDHPTGCREAGLLPLIQTSTGAISLWAWAISRLVDLAEALPEIDHERIAVAGHSRLGKAALWASAQDTRIGTVFASSSGAAGAAVSAHPVGETLAQLAARFPHWLASDPADTTSSKIDQHALLAASAPRKVYLAAAEEDLWADPLGSYMALVAASVAWPDNDAADWPAPEAMWSVGRRVVNGSLGFHLRQGGHALLPSDWHRFLEFLEGRET